MTYSTVHDIINVYICPHRVPQARFCSLVDQFLSKTESPLITLPVRRSKIGRDRLPSELLDGSDSPLLSVSLSLVPFLLPFLPRKLLEMESPVPFLSGVVPGGGRSRGGEEISGDLGSWLCRVSTVSLEHGDDREQEQGLEMRAGVRARGRARAGDNKGDLEMVTRVSKQ